ncbi:MAG: hypothetical protein ACRBN8_39015 [Nannocystales bacterium]
MRLSSSNNIAVFCLLLPLACSSGCAETEDPVDAYDSADLHEGGRLYDRIWAETPSEDFTGDHPLWAARPDTSSSGVGGTETWRCKECHGWDYLGVDGQYGTGNHRTGFPGILRTQLSPLGLFDLLSEEPGENPAGHAYGRFLSDRELWDLVRFCLEGAVSTSDIIDDSGSFVPAPPPGEALFADGIGSEPSCASCHGGSGQTMPHVDDGHEDDAEESEEPEEELEPEHLETIGSVARENPWEFHHKARFGHPGSPMHGFQKGGASHEDIGALGAFAQSLP